jgi:hypothetical protein
MLNVTGDVTNSGIMLANSLGTIAIGGDLVNHGTLQTSFFPASFFPGGGAFSVADAVRNDGTLMVDRGSFNLGGAVSNTGSIIVGGGGPGLGSIGGKVFNKVDASDPLHVKTGTISVTRPGATLDILGKVVNHSTLSGLQPAFSRTNVSRMSHRNSCACTALGRRNGCCSVVG